MNHCRSRLASAAGGVLLLALTACGSDADADDPADAPDESAFQDDGSGADLGDPAEAVQTYLQAVADLDGATVCTYLMPEDAAEAAGEADTDTCDEALSQPDDAYWPREETAADALASTKNFTTTEHDGLRATVQHRHEAHADETCDEYVLWGDNGVWQIKYRNEDGCDY